MKTRYRYTDLLGVVEAKASNKSHETPDLAKCTHFKEKKQKLLKRLQQKQKQIGEILESLTSVDDVLEPLEQKYPEEFL